MKLLNYMRRTYCHWKQGVIKLNVARPQSLIAILFFSSLTASVFVPMVAGATADRIQFDDPQKEIIYRTLIEELRCLVCQNQNLADSNAQLARDLRRKTEEMVAQGKSQQDVIDYMVARYGEFVLYRTPMNKKTYLLWFSPVIVLLIGMAVLAKLKNRKKTKVDIFSKAELDNAHGLLGLTSETPASVSHSPDKNT